MVSCNVPCLPGFGGWELFEVLQRGWHLEQLLVESQGEVEVHHCGVIDGQTADDPDQVEPVLLYKTLEMHAETLFSCCLSFTTSLWLKSEQSLWWHHVSWLNVTRQFLTSHKLKNVIRYTSSKFTLTELYKYEKGTFLLNSKISELRGKYAIIRIE